MSDIRKFMNLVELGEPGQQTNRDEQGRVLHPDVSYEISDTKVVATLKSYKSQSYTKLAQKIEEIQALEARAKALEEEIKQEGRDAIADLFAAGDAARTRVIDTVSFIMQITKDPEAATTVKYAKVIEELATQLTPELKTVMEALVKKHSTVQKAKPAALSYKMKPKNESLELTEGVWDQIKGILAKFKASIMNWGNKYDAKLDALKAEAGLTEAAVVEAPMAFSAGQTVYSGSKQGTVVGTVPNKPESTIIELPNGERDVVPTSSLTTKKPGLMKRAFSKLVGEDETVDAALEPEVEPGQQGLTELSNQPEDAYPIAATLTDEELTYFMQIWGKMAGVTADPALVQFGEELKAECAARGLAC